MRLIWALCTFALISGCATLVAPMSDKPLDTNHGKRTFGAFIEDAAIEHKVRVNLKRELPEQDNSHLVVVSFNGHLLLVGQVTDPALSQQAEAIAKRTRHVQRVYNALEHKGNISAFARMNDGWLTSKIKTRLLFARGISSKRTKVVTENGVVYLMGLLTHNEADLAVRQAQKAYGVQKIVKIIEYID